MEDPVAELAGTHGSAGAVEGAQKRVRVAAAGADEFEVALAGGVDEHDVVGLADAEALDVLHTAAELKLQVLQDATGGADGSVHAGAAEAIERLHFEVLREAVLGLIEQEEVAFDGLGAAGIAERVDDLALGVAEEQFAGLEALEFVGELGGVFELGDFKLAGGVIDVGEAEFFAFAEHGGEVVRAVRVEQIQVADGAGAEDLRDGPFDDFARHRISRLLGDGDAFAGLDELRDVTLRRMMRHAAHGHRVAFRQRHIEDR